MHAIYENQDTQFRIIQIQTDLDRFFVHEHDYLYPVFKDNTFTVIAMRTSSAKKNTEYDFSTISLQASEKIIKPAIGRYYQTDSFFGFIDYGYMEAASGIVKFSFKKDGIYTVVIGFLVPKGQIPDKLFIDGKEIGIPEMIMEGANFHSIKE
jgi:hypothetical protein